MSAIRAIDDPQLCLDVPAVFGQWFFQSVFHPEMASWHPPVIDRPSAPASSLFRMALAIAAEIAQARGDGAMRDKLLEQLDALRDSASRSADVRAIFRARDFYSGRLSLEDLEANLETESLDPRSDFSSRLQLSLSYLYQRGDHERATRHANRMVELSGLRGVAQERAWSLYALAEACQEDEPEQAERLLAEAVAITEDWDWVLLNGVSRVSLATAKMRPGHLADAAGVLRDVISDWQLRGNWLHQWVALRNAVELLAEAGQTESAARLHHAIESSPSSPEVYGVQGDRLRALAARLPHPALQTALSNEQIVNDCLTALDDLAATTP